MTLSRIVTVVLVRAALVFAVEGGEYGTRDLLRQRDQKRSVLARIDSLTHGVDSLTRLKRALATDAALQERIARENWRMVKGDRELLYVFTPDSTAPRR
jgi:cell division protein FtsB